MSRQNGKQNLLVIAYIYPPMARAGVHRTVRFVRYLAGLGWQITVLTPDEKFYPPLTPMDSSLLEKLPSSVTVYRTKIFQGLYSIFNLKRRLSGNDAVRTELAKNQVVGNNGTQPIGTDRLEELASKIKPPKVKTGKSRVQKLKDFIYDLFTIPDKDVPWLPYAVLAGWRLHKAGKFAVIYSTAPPFTGHLVGFILKKFTGKPWIADFRDPWARAPWKSADLNGTFRGKAYTYLEEKFVKSADRVILNTEWAEQDFLTYYSGKAEPKFTVIPNGFDPADFELLAEDEKKSEREKLIITHTGALYRMRDPGAFFQALAVLLESGQVSPDEIEVRFVGIIAPDLYKSFGEVAKMKEVIKIFPPVSHREALHFQQQSHILLIIQPGTSVSIPGKIFEYIALKKFILAITIPGATADVVEKNNLGVVVAPDDVEGIKIQLLSLVQKWRSGAMLPIESNGAFEHYNGKNLTNILHDELMGLLN